MSIMTSNVNKKNCTPLYYCSSADWCHDHLNLPVLGTERLGQCESQAIPLEPRRGVSSHGRGGWELAPFVHGDQYDQCRFPMVIGRQTTPFIQGISDFSIQFSCSSHCQPEICFDVQFCSHLSQDQLLRYLFFCAVAQSECYRWYPVNWIDTFLRCCHSWVQKSDYIHVYRQYCHCLLFSPRLTIVQQHLLQTSNQRMGDRTQSNGWLP